MSQTKCQTIITTGGNRGKICNRINCPYHGIKNIAEYFELPDYFVQVVNDNKNYYDYNQLTEMYERCFEVAEVMLTEYVKIIETMLLLIEKYPSKNKQVYAIIMFKFLETPVSQAFMYSATFKKFKDTVNEKYNELATKHPYFHEFTEYFTKTFKKFPENYRDDRVKK